jgi:hypothetical protein
MERLPRGGQRSVIVGRLFLAAAVSWLVAGCAAKVVPVELDLHDGTTVSCPGGLSVMCPSGTCDFYCQGPNKWYKYPAEVRTYRFLQPKE